MNIISIITINYNNAAGLGKTMQSVFSQTYEHVEYIVIDGGSTDGSVLNIGKHRTRIAYSVSEPDKGVYDAQNKGLSKATGDYVLVLNSGDELADANVVADVFAAQQHSDIVYGNMIIVHPDGRRIKGCMPEQITLEHMLRDTLWHPVSFVKRSFLHQVGLYDTSYQIVADYEWFLRAIFLHHATLTYVNRIIANFYLGGLSSDPVNRKNLARERRRAQISVLGEETVNDYERKNPNHWLKKLKIALRVN